jgi:KaiC/GvpD/RAD55 family RecA-like ATPase
MTERTIRAAQAIEQRLEDEKQGRYLDLAKMFGRNADLKMFDGDILLCVGGSGSNKTTLMQNIMHYSKEPTLYVSPEVYDHLFYRRQLQIISGKNKMDVLTNYRDMFESYHKIIDKIYLLCKGINEESLQSELAEITMKMGIKNIVLDHMKLMDFGADFTNRVEKFVAWLKPWISARGIRVFMVSQVPKSSMMPSYQTGKTRELEIYDAAGASGLYQIADIAFTINSPLGINEPVRYISFGKARDGEAHKLVDIPMRLDAESMRMLPMRPSEEDLIRKQKLERYNERIGIRNSASDKADATRSGKTS